MSVSIVASQGSSSASSAYDPKPMSLEDCAKRIQEFAKELNLAINNKKLERFNCSIALDVPKDPVVTSCGHIFERSAIQTVMNAGDPCPDCRADIVMISPVYELKGMIEEQQKQDAVPTLSCKNENKKLAELYFGMANQCIKAEQYEMAQTNLSQAFLYTKSLDQYSKLPLFYEKFKDTKKAMLAYLHLAQYQLQEGKVAEAVKTLEHCKELSPELKIDTVLLALDPSPTRIAQALRYAQKPEEEIAIYKQAIIYLTRKLIDHETLIPIREELVPINEALLPIYELLIPLLINPEEKKHYLLKAAECATQVGRPALAEEFRKKAEMRLTSITLEEWANPQLLIDRVKDSPRFKKLEEFMSGPCPIWEGKTARETHGFALKFKNFIITENGSSVEVPRTLYSLDQCDKASGGPGFKYAFDEADTNTSEEEEYELIVLTKDVLPGSRNKDYAFQKQLVESKGYEVPSAIDAATYLLWENRLSGNRLFSRDPSTYTRCRKENGNGYQLVVGGFASDGLCVIYSVDGESLGVAGLRKF